MPLIHFNYSAWKFHVFNIFEYSFREYLLTFHVQKKIDNIDRDALATYAPDENVRLQFFKSGEWNTLQRDD